MKEDKVSIVRAWRLVDLGGSMFYYESIRDDSEVEKYRFHFLRSD